MCILTAARVENAILFIVNFVPLDLYIHIPLASTIMRSTDSCLCDSVFR